MKTLLCMTSLAAMLAFVPISAQAAKRAPVDCSTAKDVEKCQAQQVARQQKADACKGKTGDDRKICRNEQIQQNDCSKARSPEICEGRKVANTACKDLIGKAYQQCLKQNKPKLDCSKARKPERCERQEKARETCKDQTGEAFKTCYRQAQKTNP